MLEEIGDIYADKHPKPAIACYDKGTRLNPGRGELFQKYGNVLLAHDLDQNSEAMDLLKQAFEKVPPADITMN